MYSKIYGVFWLAPDDGSARSRAWWGLTRNKRRAYRAARMHGAYALGHVPADLTGPWDAPTFRSLMTAMPLKEGR